MSDSKDDPQLQELADACEGSPTAGSIRMIPVDQVSALLQKLAAEQEARLQQQRGEIVREVLESIRAAGLGQSKAPEQQRDAKSLGRQPTSRSTCHGDTAAASTHRLDESLHALMLHSLSESGLDFPHVQLSRPSRRFNYEKRQNPSESDSLAVAASPQASGRENTAHDRRHIILCREEGVNKGCQSPECVLEAKRSDPSTSRGAQKDNRQRSQPREGDRVSRDHPLRKCVRGSRHRSRDAELDGDAVDQSFQATRSRIDHRTLAILDKSRALLDQPPANGEASVSAAELIQRYQDADLGAAAAVDKEKTARSLTRDTPDRTSCASDTDSGGCVPDVDEAIPGVREARVAVSARAPPPSRSRTRSSDESRGEDERDKSSPVRCDIDLLRAPDHPPDDDNEWENELARQILTIYATSVKAKAAAAVDGAVSRPSSGAARGKPNALGSLSRGSRRPEELTPSCSLPALGQRHSQLETVAGPRQSKALPRPAASVNYSWEPSQRLEDGKVVVNMPRIPKPIWFAGTGAVKAVWCALTEGYGELTATASAGASSTPSAAAPPRMPTLCSHRLCEEVRRMEAQHKFLECVTAVEALLIALVRARGASEFEVKLWKQLVVTCNAFASRCIDYKKFSAALQLMKQAERLVDNSVLVGGALRLELLAFLYDTYAHYYYRRRKPHAALEYSAKAHDIHARQSSWAHVAKSRLHMAALLSTRKQHAEALAHMGGVLALVEANRLGEGASGQKLCLVAVCYNNLAVEQLHLRAFEAAGVAAENAQRLARLCLSYSNRWLAQLDATRQCVALALATCMEPVRR